MSSFPHSNGPHDTTRNTYSSSMEREPYQRRESLVKPTWQNICPGQVSADTLEKLKKMGNSGDGPNELPMNNNNGSSLLAGGGKTDRPELGYDLFGKVKPFKVETRGQILAQTQTNTHTHTHMTRHTTRTHTQRERLSSN